MFRARSRISPSLVISLVAVTLAAGGLAYATIPSADGTIHACYSKANGALRVVDSDAVGGGRCADSETALTWSQQGPPGQVGAKGAQGAAGPVGPAGPAGGFKGVVRRELSGVMGNQTAKTLSIKCAAGEVATGGGHQMVGSIDGRVVTRSFPTGGSPPTGWEVKARRTVGFGKWKLFGYAVCAVL